MSDTSIRVSKTVRERLKERGKKGETYSEIVERLLDATEDDAGESE